MRKRDRKIKLGAIKESKMPRAVTHDYHVSPSGTDPLGSYTGVPLIGEEPEQDADDL